MGKRKKFTRKMKGKHGKNHLPRFVRFNWWRIFLRLKKELQQQEAKEEEVIE